MPSWLLNDAPKYKRSVLWPHYTTSLQPDHTCASGKANHGSGHGLSAHSDMSDSVLILETEF